MYCYLRESGGKVTPQVSVPCLAGLAYRAGLRFPKENKFGMFPPAHDTDDVNEEDEN